MSEEIVNQKMSQIIDKTLNINECDKQSFNRFDDKLTQLLLNYLSISDKILNECVSKKWKSLIFNKQQKLIITCNEIKDKMSHKSKDEIKLLSTVKKLGFYVLNCFEKSLPTLQTILKKFKSIKEIEFSGMSIEITGKVIEIIANNCHNLEKLKLNNAYFSDINEENIKLFGEKCGQNLESIVVSFFDTNNDNNKLIKSLLKFTPNLVSLNYETNSDLIWEQNQYFLKLEEIYLEQSFTFEEFKIFADNYNKQIKKIHLRLNNNEIDLNKALIELTRFESLVDLSLLLEFSNEEITSSIDNELVLIAKNCEKLENLLLYVDIEYEINGKAINSQWFQILGNFRALKSCKFFLYLSETQNFDNYMNTNYGLIESLKDCKNLKLLSLDMKQLMDKNFESIDLCLPQLKSLIIETEKCLISDQTFHKLAKMQNLSLIKIKYREIDEQDLELENIKTNANECQITDSGVCNLIINGFNIKIFKLKIESSISEKAIEEIIKRANSYPKINYKFHFVSNNKNIKDFLTNNSNKIPQNLSLKLKI
jgi:hypothetical protein